MALMFLGASSCLEGSQLSMEAQSHCLPWRQKCKDHMGGNMTGKQEIIHSRI